MSNLPITASAPQTAAKPAQATAVEDSTTQGQPFGDVLARQVSNATVTDEAPLPHKKTASKTADALLAGTQTDNTAAQTLTSDAPANLPTDMLAALLPQGAAVATQAESTTEESGLPKKTKQEATNLPQAAVTPEGVGIPQAGLPQSQAVAPEATSLSSQLAQSTSGTDSPAKPLASPLAITDLNTAQNVPKSGVGVAREALADSKKDAVFSSMLATMNATMPDKLVKTDDKTNALAASPQPNAAALASMQTTASLSPIVLPTLVTINTPVTHDNWGDEFNQKITWLANSNVKEQSAELHLNPPQLGPMDVVLKVSGDQATALFSSPHAAVREAIEQALPKLREMLADSGIMLGNASVNDQAPRNRQNDADSRSSIPRMGINAIANASGSSDMSMRVSPISRHNGIVDTFA